MNLHGQLISHYQILEKLGAGGMGVVYKARDTKLDRFVALKFLPEHLSEDETEKQRFMHEAKAASALDHPNICTIYEIGETEDGQLFICMAYYEGETLQQRVVSGQLSVNSVIEIATQIASGLAKAHEHGIAHRDLKPANVMITKEGVVKILDFGLAKLAGGTKLTKTGTTMGTAAYMSPEQVQSLPTDSRTDIWSLGVVMYEMLTGKLPFQGEHDHVIMYAIVNMEEAPLRKLRSDVPEAIAHIVHKTIAKEPEDRYQTATALLAALKSPNEEIERKNQSLSRKLAAAKRWSLYAGLATLLVALILSGLYWLPQSGPSIDSIAVLPLQNLSGDPEQEYFADGMTEALIANLGKIKSLRVISRTSIMQYKNARKSLPEIAKELNVEAVVEGSVVREGNNVRVTAQLLEALADRQLWSGSYDRNLRDVLLLQSEVTEAIVGEIRVKVTPQEQKRLVSVRPVDPEAYELYLKGRNHLNNSFDFGKALECFQKATHIDPTFAKVYAAMALTYVSLRTNFTVGGVIPEDAFPRAKAAATKALELDNTTGEAHTALGTVKFYFDWDWEGAEQEFQRALDLDPQNVDVLFEYSIYLMQLGRFDEGIAMRKKMIELDPLSAMFSMTLGWSFCQARRYDEGIAHLRKMLVVFPNHDITYSYHIARNYVYAGKYQEAIVAGEKAGEPTLLAYIYAVSDRREDALKILNRLLEISKTEYIEPMFMAMVYTGLGDKEKAFEWLAKGYEARTPYMTQIKTEPAFDPLRSDPRFVELCRNIGLEE